MKIIKNGVVQAELADKPKDFEGGIRRGGMVWVVSCDEEVNLARYATEDRARQIAKALMKAYFNDEAEFVMPEE